MDVKKKPTADVYRSRGMYLNLGFAVALLLVVSAFQWRSYGDGDLLTFNNLESDEDDLFLIPPTVHPPPPKPKIQQPKLIEVDDDEKIEELDIILDVDIDDGDAIEVVIYDDPEEEEDANYIWEGIIEKEASPVGGMTAFNQFLRKNLKYPSQARRMGIEGKVFLQFVVDRDGSLNDIKVIRGIGAGCDEEAIRVLKKHPKWSPGEQRGRPVRVRMIIPIFFKLG